jgi:hypothetical protein
LDIPDRVSGIEMLSGHWAALKAVPEIKYKKYALHLFNLKHPDRVHVPLPTEHHVYYDVIDDNKDSFTFCAVTIDVTKHDRIFTRYRIYSDNTLSILDTRTDNIPANTKSEYTWSLLPLTKDGFGVYGTPFGGHFNLFVYNESDPEHPMLSLAPEVGDYYPSCKKDMIIFVKKSRFGLCYLSSLKSRHFVKAAPKKNFRVVIMGELCIFENNPGVFGVVDSYYYTPRSRRSFSLTEYLPEGVRPNIHEVGLTFISGMQLHVHNVCGIC